MLPAKLEEKRKREKSKGRGKKRDGFMPTEIPEKT